YRPSIRRRQRGGMVAAQLVSFGTDYVPPRKPLETEVEKPEQDEGPQQTMIDVLLERLENIGPRAHQVWLPPLRQPATLDQLLPPLVDDPELGPRPVGDLQVSTLTVPIGLVDLPAQQRRELLGADLSGSRGNVAVVGGPQSGKSTVLRTMIA